jgi:hypothetical protein
VLSLLVWYSAHFFFLRSFLLLVDNYLELVSKSSIAHGSSSNLELGLHVFFYLRGDVKQCLKAFMQQSIQLPANNPISNYKYAGKCNKTSPK